MAASSLALDKRVEEMTRVGLWGRRLAVDYLDEAARLKPDQAALTALNSTLGQQTTLSYRQLKRLSERIALSLVAQGVAPGDIVSCQLPNWWEMVVLYFGCARIGVVLNPIMPIFRQRELSYMLSFAESVMMVVPRLFRGFDYPAMAAEVRAGLPKLKRVLVVGGEGEDSFAAAMLARRFEDEPGAEAILRERRPDPNAPTELLYTSGTTGEPKGVLHSPNTLLAALRPFARRLGLSQRDVILMASPMAHQTGFLYGLVMPVFLGARAVLQDVWSAEQAAQLIQDEGVTFTMAATPFLMDLADSPAVERYDVKPLAIFLTAGAPIPRALVERASSRLGVKVISAWGMTENGAVTTTRPLDPPEKTINTDGKPLAGSEVRVVDESGNVLPAGVEGRLQERGACDFLGYLKRPDLDNRDAQGWFDTGDLARIDADGYIRITGRSKDIIIRGGENIPVVEVENLLYQHPAIQDAAVVAMPDARLGERACAFVTLRPGKELTFEELTRFLEERHMARHYFPERLEVLEQLPRTPSGKIQKFKLREAAHAFAATR